MTQPLPVEIVSPGVPCGLYYLINNLLAMEVPTFTGRAGAFWQRENDGSFTVRPLVKLKYAQGLPVLIENSRFQFNCDREPWVSWSHGWPTLKSPKVKRIVYMRDPRDALYSQYKRLGLSSDIKKFLNESVSPFGFDRKSNYYLRLILWHHMRDKNTMFVRFEDLKASPQARLQEILRFIGIERSAATIDEAIQRSDTERIKKLYQAETVSVGKGTVETVIRRGKTFEWKERIGAPDLSEYDDAFSQAFIRKFAYEESKQTPVNQKSVRPEKYDHRTARLARKIFGISLWFGDSSQRRAVYAALSEVQAIDVRDPVLLHELSGAGSVTQQTTFDSSDYFRILRHILSYRTYFFLRMAYLSAGLSVAESLYRLFHWHRNTRVWIEQKILEFPFGER